MLVERLCSAESKDIDRVGIAGRVQEALEYHAKQHVKGQAKLSPALWNNIFTTPEIALLFFERLDDISAHINRRTIASMIFNTAHHCQNTSFREIRVVAARAYLRYLRRDLRECDSRPRRLKLIAIITPVLAAAVAEGLITDPSEIFDVVCDLKSLSLIDPAEHDAAAGTSTEWVEQDTLSDADEQQVITSDERLSRIQAHMQTHNACALEFFIGKTGGFALMFSNQGVCLHTLNISGRGLKRTYDKMKNMAAQATYISTLPDYRPEEANFGSVAAKVRIVRTNKEADLDNRSDIEELGSNDTIAPGLVHPLQQLREHLSEQSLTDRFKGNTDVLWRCLQSLARKLFPEPIMQQMQGADLIYLASHGSLRRFPLHLLPIPMGRNGIGEQAKVWMPGYEKPTLYLPNCAFLARDHRPNVAKDNISEDVYLCVDVQDEQICHELMQDLDAPATSLTLTPGVVNHWHDKQTPLELCHILSLHRTSLLLTHGMIDKDPLLTRLAIPGGARLCMADILRQPYHANEKTRLDFSGSEVLVIACNSLRNHRRREATDMSLVSAFLRRNADAVMGCGWQPVIEDGVCFGRLLLQNRLCGHTRAISYQHAIRAMLDEESTRLLGFLRAASFYYVGIEDNSNPARAVRSSPAGA